MGIMTADVWPAFFFRAPSGKPGSEKSGDQPKGKEQEARKQAVPYLCCRQCHEKIARAADGISIGGSHRHTFANPHGIVFEIGCFGVVVGCGTVGQPSDEFSWFPGYRWQIAICGQCLSHLGWSFRALGKAGFHGLILDRLIELSTL